MGATLNSVLATSVGLLLYDNELKTLHNQVHQPMPGFCCLTGVSVMEAPRRTLQHSFALGEQQAHELMFMQLHSAASCAKKSRAPTVSQPPTPGM